MHLLRLRLAFLLVPPAAALADTPPVIISPAPDAVAVTVYRNPERGAAAIDRDAPAAFALIAETRTVTLPPGRATVRFEGVASGIVPHSAILFGTDPRERNRDAALLSHKGLVDAFTGQRATLRRTDPATGRPVAETVTIRSAADRLVVSGARGVEALYCSGLNQTLLYPDIPATLSAKPVLSMTTRDQPGGRATITLAYIATGFDWDASYVATLAHDGRALALLGWLTMASGDDTSFADTTASAVAGRIARSDETRDETGVRAKAEAAALDTRGGCWPAGTTSDVGLGIPPPPPSPAPMALEMDGADIVVTAQRREAREQAAPLAVSVIAKAETLGDLKLYRIPVPVTVAARSQKQVAFLAKDRVAGTLVYRARMEGESPGDPELLFRFRNRLADGLGDPLPAGRIVLYQGGRWGRMYVGEATTPDRTVDEEVEFVFGDADDVTIVQETRETSKRRLRHGIVVRNANPFAVRFELEFPAAADRDYDGFDAALAAKPGKRVWIATIPANDMARLGFRSFSPQ